MHGYTSDYVNLIANNLRDRYENGFPILKELIQNADDAKAGTLIFGRHDGFLDASHPLLKGPGLWFFNDGKFDQSDANALRSFGINSKAGDATAIGKFGLGMKSVFHLCEALFYVAWDGTRLHREGLTPWKQDGHWPHPEWDETGDADWEHLAALGKGFTADRARNWFLLWLPLRMRRHLKTPSGQESGAIINRFPGDDPSNDLGFLSDATLSHDLAELLPLLQHLERIEHRGKDNRFALQLRGGPRLMGDPSSERAGGQVLLGDGNLLLAFSGGRTQSPDADRRFADMKAQKEWPAIRYRDELGRERQDKDRKSPEAAVLFCSGQGSASRSRLQWAVFLPVEYGSEDLASEDDERRHSLVLHGQFFLDAGRKKIHGQEHLNERPADLHDARIDEGSLRTAWNQRLAQEVLLPLVLPALSDYAQELDLSDDEHRALAKTLSDSQWFKDFGRYVCRDAFWMRTLPRGTGSRWRLVEGDDRWRLRPVPTPPSSAPERPWEVFPNLITCNLTPYDVEAPRLRNAPAHWQQEELATLLFRVDGMFEQAPAMDYIASFLDSCARPCLPADVLQRRLVVMLRESLRSARPEARRQFATKARRLIDFVELKRRLPLSSELPERVLESLWSIDTSVLLIPKNLAADGDAVPDEQTLANWLGVLDRALDSEERGQEPILEAVQELLKTLPPEAQGRFLRRHRTLRVIGVWDARSGVEKPVSFDFLEEVRATRTLFHYAAGLRETRVGIAPQIAQVLPEVEVCLVRAQTYRELFPDDRTQEGTWPIPAANDGRACLAAVGCQRKGQLGNLVARRELLERANDPGTDSNARRGLRLLLHGSRDHRTDDTAQLWVSRHGQHPAWERLWAAMHQGDRWTLVPEELANAIPGNRWGEANIAEIDAETLIRTLDRTDLSIKERKKFTVEEREEILSRIENEEFWRRLTLHTTLDGHAVSASGERVYLAPQTLSTKDALAREATLIVPSRNALVANKQKRWLRPLDDRARIELALGTAEPSRHWRSVMDALDAIDEAAIKGHLRAVLRCTAWLPATHGTPTKPEDVIDLEGALGDEAHRLVAVHGAEYGPCFAAPADCNDAVRNHEAWKRLRKFCFSGGIAGLERLALLLDDLSDQHVGKWPKQPEPEELELLARCERLPGWRLLAAAATVPFDLETAWGKLGPALSRDIDTHRLVDALTWLSGDGGQWKLRKSIHDTYLGHLAARQVAKDHLPHLRLASADLQWREAAELCAGAHGVVRDRLLDDRQWAVLGDLVCSAGSRERSMDTSGDPSDIPFRVASTSAPAILRDYFRAWNSNLVPAPMVGVMLSLLGPDLRELAKEYLKPHSIDWFFGQLRWRAPRAIPQQQFLALVRVKTAEQAVERVQARVRVIAEDDVEVTSLLGKQMRVALDQEMPTLLAGALRYHWREYYGVLIPLRRIDPDGRPKARLRALLRATAERLYSELYNQESVNFSSLWRELDRSDQLEVSVARRLILEHIPFYLRQLSIKCEGIEAQLATCDERRRRIAEAETDGQPAESVREELREALEELASLINQGTDEQYAVLEAVKGKLQQYQYDPSSIPFELFQNADDAAIELGQFHSHAVDGCKVPVAAQHFVVEERDDGLGFLHWGRPINGRGPVGFNIEDRGYDRDLEKMLILSASDKRSDEGVTGKFGLGFKSVLLACEQPRIVSGRLAVRVVSGILPEPWDDDDAREAGQRLANLGNDPKLPGTLIDLQGVQGELRNLVLQRFQQLSGILCVFARTLRTITCIAASESNWCWRARKICPGVEVGQLHIQGDWGARTTAICVRTDSGNLLMALGPQGFRPLPDAVPALWVTAPTRDSPGFGFAINGRFDLDAGRGRLAGNTANNLETARRIGVEAGEALAALLQRSREDWVSTRADLGTAVDLDALDYWQSIWLGLTKACLRSSGGDGTGLVRAVALGALARLCECPPAVPNGLARPLRGFADAGEVRYALSRVLLSEEVAATLGAWTRFTDRYSERNCVSQEIGDILCEANLCHLLPLGLPVLVDMLDRSRAEPADAEVLGRLLILTGEASDWKSDDLRKRLNKVLFQSEEGQWVEPRELLTLHGTGDPDEGRQHAVAPPECRLHPDYYVETEDEWPGVVFFLVCRQRMEAPAEKLAGWVRNAKSTEQRSAALDYLAEGDLGERVADHVRDQGWLQSALAEPRLRDGLTPQQADRLHRRLLPTEALDRVADLGSTLPIPPPRPSPSAVLAEVHAWWMADRLAERPAYDDRAYPQGFSPSRLRESDDRTEWFTMFALARFQSLGRTQDEQHRGFIAGGWEGWWRDLAQSKPPSDVQSWLDRLERWSSASTWKREFLPWKGTFVDLYTVVRHLDVYIEIFRKLPGIIKNHGPVSLGDLLDPTYSPVIAPLGLDAAPLNRSVGIGANWMIRELVRHRVYDADDADSVAPYCWAPTLRVRKLLNHLGATIESADNDASRHVFRFIEENLNPIGAEGVHFDGDFDLPLQLVTLKARRDTLSQCFEKAGSEAPALDDSEIDEISGYEPGEDAR